ncbi:AraC family transcriptional regulator [Pseudooceanicola atlanticus]|uniref:AraC family transcriptional regulator n=1 Tax=Pseudooceanicola atlanticus TaxID=1461694 RepID=A0A0A0EEV5_9RHOB|nr:helix-turn-helix domain-containing protein [Pseudooceanicola atlanticus]KGM48914.1 AraC family transcriptional regulator [Pseudooceanicola atlanticus]
MLSYHSKHWEESARSRADFGSLLFSAPDHFNMSKGRDRKLIVNSADFPDIGTSLLSVTSSGHEIDLADDKYLTVMIPTHGQTHVHMDRRKTVIQEGSALALGPSERWTRVEKGRHRDFRANLAKISLDAAPLRHVLPVVTDDPVLPTAPKALAGFRALMHYLFSDLASPMPTLIHRPASDLFAALVLEHIRMMFQTGMDRIMNEKPQHSLVSRAEEFMVANLGEPLTVPIMAEALGVSVRQLQDAFRQSVKQSPWERLTAHRLDKARRNLLAGGGDTVTAIAFDCGFSHLGRFAQTYRATFGEAPSATLRRGRMRRSANRIDDTQTG